MPIIIVDCPTTPVPWYQVWSNTQIELEDTFDSGDTYLTKENLDPGKFTLRPVYTKDANGHKTIVRFKVKYWTWQMNPLLKGLLMTPRGDACVELGEKLPPWDPDSDDIRKKYDEVLSDLVKKLQEKDDPGYRRLESLFSVGANDKIAVDIVRMVYLKNAVKAGSGYKDLALVVFGKLEAGPDQNGGGSGPPDRH